MAPEPAVPLGDGRDLAELLRVGIQLVEQIAAGVEQIDLVRRHQRAQRQRIAADKFYRRAIVLGRRVDGDIDALEAALDAQRLCPDGENAHDRGLAGGYADKIHRRLRGGIGKFHHKSSLL